MGMAVTDQWKVFRFLAAILHLGSFLQKFIDLLYFFISFIL